MASYVGSVLLLFTGVFLASILLYGRELGQLLDPTGIRFLIEDIASEWTVTEKSSRLLTLDGLLLRNRVTWIGIALGALALTHGLFRFAHRSESAPKKLWRRPRSQAQVATEIPVGSRVLASMPISIPQSMRTFGFALQVRQAWAIAWNSFRTMATRRVGLAMMGILPLMTVPILLAQLGVGGAMRIPRTALILDELTAPLMVPLSAELNRWVIIPLFLIFFAGEIVWQERDAGLGDISDALPTSEWPPLLGKVLGLGLVLALYMGILVGCGVLVQVMSGYRDLQLGLYVTALLGLQLSEYCLFAVLAVVVHVLANRKYVGHLVALLAYGFIAMPALFKVAHPMLVFGGGPEWAYSDLRGFGASLEPWAQFKLYWGTWACALVVIARLLWPRGRDDALATRFRHARRRLTRPTLTAAALAVGLVVTLGGFTFYDTNVRNGYRSKFEYQELLADYERRYGRYERVPQPRLEGVRLQVEIYPAQGDLEVKGTYLLVNRSTVAIDTIHVATIPGATRAVTFAPAALPVVTDEVRGHRMYALTKALQPGDSVLMQFEVFVPPAHNRGIDAAVVPNGSFFTNADWLPAMGYQAKRALMLPSDRAAHGLPRRPVLPSLYDTTARFPASAQTTFEAVVGTSVGQTAIAPGALRGTWSKGDRRYFHYITDHPIPNDYAIFSARYAVREARWGDVDIRIFHHPTHTSIVDRMMRSAQASLAYYSAQFGAYPYRHLTFVEVRGNEIGMHADASLIRFSEGTALWNPWNNTTSHDLAFSVTAHEVAHQWWGHQLQPALAEGAPVIGEGLAEFSSMGVTSATHGAERLQRHLAFLRNPEPYPPVRRGEPLLRGMDPYLAYKKAPFALNTLGEHIGRDRVSGALRQLLAQHPPGRVPLATTLDLYRELQAVTPDSLQGLLHDLFEVNTLWEFRVERATAAQTAAGAWQVTLSVHARKILFDSAGGESDLPIREPVQIGVFAPPERGDRLSAPLYVAKHRLQPGMQIITVTVPTKPALAGIDPFHLFDWDEREEDNNVKDVIFKG